MKNYEGIDIGDNVKECDVCPNCKEKDERYSNIVNTPMVDGKRTTFYTWTCYNCNKELISAQDY